MDDGAMAQEQQEPARTSTALGAGTAPGDGSRRQREQQNKGKCREGVFRGENPRAVREGRRSLPGSALPADAALGWGTPGAGAAAPQQTQAQQHRAAPAQSLPISTLGHRVQGEFPTQGLSVLTIPAGKTAGM